MRSVSLIILLALGFGCEKPQESQKADFFMKQVITESYNNLYLPDLSPSDISALLKYRNNHKILFKFPANPISSFICDSVTAGAIALSTIETIRISELYGARNEFTVFPSNPCIVDTSHYITNRFVLIDSVGSLYYNWWINSDLGEPEKIIINPLYGTSFKWN